MRSCVSKSHKFHEAFANLLSSSGIKFCTWKIRRKCMLAYKMYDHGRKTHLTPARLVFHNCWSTDDILKHISVHNSGPWAPTKTIFGPNESSECDLADGKPPKPLGRHLDGIISVQRVKMNTKHQKNHQIGQNRCSRARNEFLRMEKREQDTGNRCRMVLEP